MEISCKLTQHFCVLEFALSRPNVGGTVLPVWSAVTSYIFLFCSSIGLLTWSTHLTLLNLCLVWPGGRGQTLPTKNFQPNGKTPPSAGPGLTLEPGQPSLSQWDSELHTVKPALNFSGRVTEARRWCHAGSVRLCSGCCAPLCHGSIWEELSQSAAQKQVSGPGAGLRETLRGFGWESLSGAQVSDAVSGQRALIQRVSKPQCWAAVGFKKHILEQEQETQNYLKSQTCERRLMNC